MKQCRMRTVTVVMTYMLGAASLASLALAGCSKDPAGGTVDPGREAVILSIAEANYGVSGGARRSGTSPANGGAPQTRAIVDGGGSMFFTDGDRLGLFLRGDGYEDVDNRIVQLDYPGEGPQKKWNITGEAIPLYADAATVTAYFPYSDAFGLTMSAIPLNSGPYDVNSNDVVWQRDTVHAAHTQAMFLEMQHAMTRVKIRLSGGRKSIKVGDLNGGGVVYWVNPDDENDFRVVALDQSGNLKWAANNNYVLGSGAQDQSARNGSDVWQLAKQYSDNKTNGASGTFATDFPAFSYCYEKTDGGVTKGTWFLPSLQELKDLYDAKGSVESVITANGGTIFLGSGYWSATESNLDSDSAWVVYFFTKGFSYVAKSRGSNVDLGSLVRCIRHPLASEVSASGDYMGEGSGDYTGEGKITGVRIADAGDVASEDRVVYLDGTLDLTQATPVVTPGWPDAVADKSEKTLTAKGVLYDLLLLPVDKIDAGKVLLEVELDGKVLSVPFPVDAVDKWEAGKAYTYEVLVRNGGAQVVFGKATVTPWNYGGSISGDLDTSKPEYGGGDVQDWGDNEWESGEGGDEPVTGEIADVSLVPAPTDNVILAEGGEYSVRLTGNWTGSVPVRMSVGGDIGGLLHAVCSDGAATVTFVVPANDTGADREVLFEYRWNSKWIACCTVKQKPLYEVTPQGDIPGLGGTYSVRFEEGYATEGMKVRARSGDTSLAEVTITDPKTLVQLKVPENHNSEKTTREVIFEFYHNDAWVQIGDTRTQDYSLIGDEYKGAIIYWQNPENKDDFRAIAPTERTFRGAKCDIPLHSDEFNGKAFCASVVDQLRGGDGTTVADAIVWCYDMTVENDRPGTYYLPTAKELVTFNDNYEILKERCPELISSLQAPSTWYYTCTKSGNSSYPWNGVYLNGNKSITNGSGTWGVRCVRQRD